MKKMYNLPHSLAYNEKMALLNDSMKVTFVRHPFVRLVSAYQDKIVDHPYKNWRQKCFTFQSCCEVRFRFRLYLCQFIFYLFHFQFRYNNTPNFDQFIEFVLAEHEHSTSLDTHLEYFWRKCDVCNLNYDIIGKVETSLDDNRYIFNRVSLSSFLSKTRLKICLVKANYQKASFFILT